LHVPLAAAEITADDERSVLEALRSGWLTHGPYNAQFEEAFAAYTGTRHAISTNSCASALHASLLALGVRGEVILPSFTFVASANAVVTAGATPVFVDIDPDTCNIQTAAIEKAVSSRTEAIMPVHFAGQACNMDAIAAIAARHQLVVIEDSAEAIGAEYGGRKTGTFGAVGCFSFYPTKNMTTGEGGMVTTDDEQLANRIRTLTAHGISSSALARERQEQPWLRASTVAGYNFRLSNVLAALGLSQLSRLDNMNALRREHAAAYLEGLHGFEELVLPVEADRCFHVWQMFTVKLQGLDRTRFLGQLRDAGVGATVHFDPPVHRQPFYESREGFRVRDLPVTERIASTIVTLPLWPSMAPEQRRHVTESVIAAVTTRITPTASR
jgi:dTDP-4-amino-4,6-dideoxygalactose transaminase